MILLFEPVIPHLGLYPWEKSQTQGSLYCSLQLAMKSQLAPWSPGTPPSAEDPGLCTQAPHSLPQPPCLDSHLEHLPQSIWPWSPPHRCTGWGVPAPPPFSVTRRTEALWALQPCRLNLHKGGWNLLNLWDQTRRTFQVMPSATRWHLRCSSEEMALVHQSFIHLQTHGQSTLCQPMAQPPAEALQPRGDKGNPYEGCAHVS